MLEGPERCSPGSALAQTGTGLPTSTWWAELGLGARAPRAREQVRRHLRAKLCAFMCLPLEGFKNGEKRQRPNEPPALAVLRAVSFCSWHETFVSSSRMHMICGPPQAHPPSNCVVIPDLGLLLLI